MHISFHHESIEMVLLKQISSYILNTNRNRIQRISTWTHTYLGKNLPYHWNTCIWWIKLNICLCCYWHHISMMNCRKRQWACIYVLKSCIRWVFNLIFSTYIVCIMYSDLFHRSNKSHVFPNLQHYNRNTSMSKHQKVVKILLTYS